MELRASSLPLFFQCAQSATPAKHPVDEPSDAAALGNAVHEGLAQYIGSAPEDSPSVLAERHGVKADDVAWLIDQGVQAWAYIEQAEGLERKDSRVETYFQKDLGPSLRLTGHADFVEWGEDQITVIDWKTGYVERRHDDQLKAYALLASRELGRDVVVYTAYLRSGRLHRTRYTSGEVSDWSRSLADRARDQGKAAYNPGEHCTFCPRRNECGARAEALAIAPAEFGVLPLDDAPDDIASMLESESFRQSLLDTYAKARAVENAAERFRKNFKSLVADQGEISAGGKSATLVERTRSNGVTYTQLTISTEAPQ